MTYDAQALTINTSDALGFKAYNFRVDAFEPLSGLTNTDVKFKVVSSSSKVATAITVASSTLIPDSTHLVNDPAVVYLCPSYIKFPSYVNV